MRHEQFDDAGFRAAKQTGFTLVEILIALSIALFIIGGLLTLVNSMKRTSVSQNGMSQLQDSERLSVTLLTDVIQTAGYWPNPAVLDVKLAFPAFGSFAQQQTVFGTGASGAAPPGDTVAIRYLSSPTDGVLNCLGGTNATGGTVTFVNEFSIVVDASGLSNLQCKLTVIDSAGNQTITITPLVSNVQNLQVYYGVKANATTNTSVDTYLDATQVVNWNNVMSVKLKLTFLNPLANQPGQSPIPTITFTRLVTVMNTTGVL